MAKEYKINVDGYEIVYGPLVEQSRFTDEEWDAIHLTLAKENLPEAYELYKDDDVVVSYIGSYVDLSEHYEALLELLPQDTFSMSGTHPRWVADLVEENTLSKSITQDDIKMLIDECADLNELKSQLIDYFGIEE